MGKVNYKWSDIINIPFTIGKVTRGSAITTSNQYFNRSTSQSSKI